MRLTKEMEIPIPAVKRTAAWAAIGMMLSAVSGLAQHPDEYARADILYGAGIFAAQCAGCHGANGAGVPGTDLASGKFRNATNDQTLRMLITRGLPTSGMPAFALDAAGMTGIIAYLRNMKTVDRGTLKSGDAGRGRAVAEGKGACLTCHRIDGKGSRRAADLSDIGAARSAGYLERALVDPTGQMWPINRPVRIVTGDGRTINGRRLNEDTYTVQVAADDGQLISLTKQGLREYKVSTESPMPSYKSALTQDELADLVSYLLSLKGL